MIFGENKKIKSVIRKRLVELHPENCEYCGGFQRFTSSIMQQKVIEQYQESRE